MFNTEDLNKFVDVEIKLPNDEYLSHSYKAFSENMKTYVVHDYSTLHIFKQTEFGKYENVFKEAKEGNFSALFPGPEGTVMTYKQNDNYTHVIPGIISSG